MGVIQTRFDSDDGVRQENLERARFCASLTKPWVLPPDGWNESEKLPETFSSIPARGCTNLEGRLLLAIFPPGQPWFKFKPASKFKFDPEVEPDLINEFEEALRLQELVVLSKMEQSDKTGGNARRLGFRTRMRLVLSQLLVTGDCLFHLTDDFNIRVFRRDNYVTNRDMAGDINYHITREHIDLLTLPLDKLELLEHDVNELSGLHADQRMEFIYTMVEWNPLKNVWVITQEVDGVEINKVEEAVNPYISVTYSLPPAADYGRGLIEENLGDCRSINELTERILDFAALSSKHLFALDYNSQVRPDDLARPTGSVIQARVQGGQVSDVGMVRADRMNDFNVVASVRDAIRRDLAMTMLMEGETTPRGERVTAYQVQRVAAELDGALSGLFAPIADALQVPLVERVRHVLTKRGELPVLPDDTVEIEAITGVQALAHENDQQKLLRLLQTVAQLGPETLARVDKGVLLDLLVRQSGIYQPGLIRSEEDIQEEMQSMQQGQFDQMAASQAVQTAGNVIEEQQKQEMQGV